MVLFLQQAELFVELHLNTDEGVNFASGVELFILAPVETDRYQTIQHSFYPTIPLFTKFLTPIFLMLRHVGPTSNHWNILCVYLLLV